MRRLHAGKPPPSQAQYTALLYSSRAFAEPATPGLQLPLSTPACSLQYSSAAAQLRVRARYQWRLPASRLQARRARVAPARSRPSPIPFASSLLPLRRFDILRTFPISGLTSSSPPHRSLLTHCGTASIHQCRLVLSVLVRCPFRLARGLALRIRIYQQDAQRALSALRVSRHPPGAHSPSHPAFVLHPLPFSSKAALRCSTLDVFANSRPRHTTVRAR
jgi:hypothetical protein